jgi:hypothetical protein
MKKPNLFKRMMNPLKVLLFMLCCLSFIQATHAQYHLIVDIYDPTNVTFTATEELALADDTITTMFDGIGLKNF